jgi:leucyl aminopeptidase (aminopeptidase T)
VLAEFELRPFEIDQHNIMELKGVRVTRVSQITQHMAATNAELRRKLSEQQIAYATLQSRRTASGDASTEVAALKG